MGDIANPVHEVCNQPIKILYRMLRHGYPRSFFRCCH
jgi:hypothetical protein